MRAIEGMWMTAIASTSAQMFAPAPVAITSRKRMGGKARRTSIDRISRSSKRLRV